MTEAELLKYAIENGMLDTALVQKNIEMQKRKELLEMHKYDIWQGTNGKWYTYLPDDQKGRVLKKRNSQEDIENLVVEYYRQKEETHYLEDVFNAWVEEKLEYGEIQKQTYDRYKTDFHRFFDGQDISKTDIKYITEEYLEHFVKETIRDKELTNKAYAGLRTIVMGIFRYAKKKKYTSMSITQFFGDIDISRKTFKKKVVEDEDSVFTDAEVGRIVRFIEEEPEISIAKSVNDPSTSSLSFNISNLFLLSSISFTISVSSVCAETDEIEMNINDIIKTIISFDLKLIIKPPFIFKLNNR